MGGLDPLSSKNPANLMMYPGVDMYPADDSYPADDQIHLLSPEDRMYAGHAEGGEEEGREGGEGLEGLEK